jgi:hypothetical protein
MLKLAIVVIGYNRLVSIKRMLSSLISVNYGNDIVDLIISIDNSGKYDVEDYARQFIWNNGEKIIKTYEQRLGLRNHVLRCGDYVENYDAIAVFEDDIYVSPDFYRFMKSSVSFYKNDKNIAGISLYSHKWSEYVRRPFHPEKRKYDTYFMQFAQSWGQIWMRDQWFEFKKWYDKNQGNISQSDDIPHMVTDWPDTSWLKYHITYCIKNNKYFVYPYDSLTTNFTDVGQHCKDKNKIFQVPLTYTASESYNFPNYGKEDAVYYDGFFERQFIGKYFGIDDESLCVDIYAGKVNREKRYLLSSKKLNYKIISSYALELKPHELNAVLKVEGNDIYLYDTSEIDKNIFYGDEDLVKWYYDSRTYDNKVIVKMLLDKIKNKVLNKLRIR